MKFKIIRSKFFEGLKNVQNVVNAKSTVPVLQNVLISVKNNELQMTTTDLDISIVCSVECESVVDGATTLPVKLLFSAVMKLDEGEIEIESNENERASITSGKSKFRLIGIKESDFPKLPDEEEFYQYKIQQSTLREMFRKTAYAASQDDTRRTLKGVLLSFKNQKLTMVATDGRRLAMIEQEFEYPATNDKDIVLPQKTVQELLRALNGNEELKINVQKSQICFSFGKTKIYSKLIEENYPNYVQVIPKEVKETIKIDRLMMLNALERASIMTMDENHSTRLVFEENKLRIMSATNDIGDASDEVDVKYAGEQIEIMFNPNYLMDTLKAIDDDEITICLNDGHTPAIIKCSIPFLYVIMPLRIA